VARSNLHGSPSFSHLFHRDSDMAPLFLPVISDLSRCFKVFPAIRMSVIPQGSELRFGRSSRAGGRHILPQDRGHT
jgi:hypothetical protein